MVASQRRRLERLDPVTLEVPGVLHRQLIQMTMFRLQRRIFTSQTTDGALGVCLS